MKITKSQLKEIIREEIQQLNETFRTKVRGVGIEIDGVGDDRTAKDIAHNVHQYLNDYINTLLQFSGQKLRNVKVVIK
jgi:hypothetical protein